jgi:EAL domain-containing protein (putative c-di-GMP-specific phosphodiesterase class I)
MTSAQVPPVCYLPTLPFDALKIDRSFVKELSTKPESRAMVHSLVSLAHNIGMRVIVEGIEIPEQLELIRKFGGDEIQGDLIGRPTPDPAAQLPTLSQGHAHASQSDEAMPNATMGEGLS